MRIVIAEDLVLLREGIASLLTDSGHEVVAGVGDGEALLEALAEHSPDLAIVDVRMPPTYDDEGMKAAAEIRRSGAPISVATTCGSSAEPPSLTRRAASRKSSTSSTRSLSR